MAPAYKLTYFNSRGLAEPSRFIFAYTGTDYEDIRIEKSEWEPQKKNYPWGQLPVLEVEGMVLCQSMTIARFLARRFNLAGANEKEMAKCDELIDTIKDKMSELSVLYRETDEAKKEEAKKKLATETAPKFLSKMEDLLKANGGKFLVGQNWTWVDFGFVCHLSYYTIFFGQDYLDPYPIIKAHAEGVHSIPQIKAWMDKRPITQM